MAEPEEISLRDEIERLAASEPFQPFVIIMVSGQRYEITARDGVMAASSVVVITPHAGGIHLLRQTQISEVSVAAD